MTPSLLMLAASIGSAPRAVPVMNGEDATACQFPSVVALVTEDGAQFCTGSIVAPRIVLTAGHCIDAGAAPPAARILLGEDVSAPVLEIDVEACVVHPDYQVLFDEQGFGTDLGADIGYCRLTADAPAVPIVPIAAGCETDAFVPGGELVIVGFGSTDGGVTKTGEKWAEGNGLKRWKAQTIEVVDAAKGEVVMTSADGSACFGDSGGPTMARLADDTWRIVGVGSSLHPDDPTQCGLGAAYELVAPHLGWLEEETGVDLTPCFADDGAWAPTEACDEFPIAPLQGGDWTGLCEGLVAGPGASCAPEGGSSSGGDDESDGGAGPTTAAADADSSEASTGADTSESDGGESSGVGGASEAEGCGCSVPGRRGLLALIMVPALRRRRCNTGRERSMTRS